MEVPKKGKTCCVRGCQTKERKHVTSVSMHRIPWKTPEVCRLWFAYLRRSGTDVTKISKDSRICSLHFTSPACGGQPKVPSLFPGKYNAWQLSILAVFYTDSMQNMMNVPFSGNPHIARHLNRGRLFSQINWRPLLFESDRIRTPNIDVENFFKVTVLEK